MAGSGPPALPRSPIRDLRPLLGLAHVTVGESRASREARHGAGSRSLGAGCGDSDEACSHAAPGPAAPACPVARAAAGHLRPFVALGSVTYPRVRSLALALLMAGSGPPALPRSLVGGWSGREAELGRAGVDPAPSRGDLGVRHRCLTPVRLGRRGMGQVRGALEPLRRQRRGPASCGAGPAAPACRPPRSHAPASQPRAPARGPRPRGPRRLSASSPGRRGRSP